MGAQRREETAGGRGQLAKGDHVMRVRTSDIGAAVILIAAVLTTPACGALRHPDTAKLSVEGQAAVGGRQLVAAITSAATSVDILIDTGQLPKDEGVKVLQVLRTVGVESQRLAEALAIIDTTKDETAARFTAIQKAGDIIKGIQAAVLRGIVPIGSEVNRGKVAALLDGIAAALVVMGQAIPGEPSVAWLEPEWMGVAA
jgi:hypothetical protein